MMVVVVVIIIIIIIIIIIGRMPTRKFRYFTFFLVNSTSNAICGHAGIFKHKPILLNDFLNPVSD